MADIARLLIVARAGPLADSLGWLLTSVPGIEVIGPVDDLSSPPPETLAPPPTAVLLVLSPTTRRPQAMVMRVRSRLPESGCVVLADDVQQQWAAEEAGADVVLLKGCRPSELVSRIQDLLMARRVLQ